MCDRKSRGGFTLLEILTVISIIAILAGIFIPIIGRAMDSARKSSISNNLRQIAMAYYYIINNNDSQRMSNKTVHDFAVMLAEKADLNDVRFWVIDEDPLVERFGNGIASPIVFFDNGERVVNNEFKECPLSIVVAKGVSMNVNVSTTPIAWTRGLGVNGKWASYNDDNPGVFGDKGGFIAFLDGHVKWYADLGQNGGLLIHYVTRKPTNNIYEALPPYASVLD